MNNFRERFDLSNVNIIVEDANIRSDVQVCEKHKHNECRCNRLSPREMAIIKARNKIWIDYVISEKKFLNKGDDSYDPIEEINEYEVDYTGFDADGRAILTEYCEMASEYPEGSSKPDPIWYDGKEDYMDSDEYKDRFYYSRFSQYELLATKRVNYTIFLSYAQYNNLIGSTDAIIKYFNNHDIHEFKTTLKGCNINATVTDVIVSGLILENEVPSRCDLSQTIILSSTSPKQMAENQLNKIVSRWKYKMSVSIKKFSNENTFDPNFSFVLTQS